MSMSYWGIVGYGVCVQDIEKYLNHPKVNRLVAEMNANTQFDEDVFEDYTFYGEPYSNFAEFLCELDETNSLIYDDNGNGECYFMYAPKYPWSVKENDPKSYKDVDDRILKVLKQVCDATEEELRDKIDFINTYGCG